MTFSGGTSNLRKFHQTKHVRSIFLTSAWIQDVWPSQSCFFLQARNEKHGPGWIIHVFPFLSPAQAALCNSNFPTLCFDDFQQPRGWMCPRLAGGQKLPPVLKFLLKAKGKGASWSSNRPGAATDLGHPISKECLHVGCSPRACFPAAGQSGATPRWLMGEWDTPMPGGRILMQPDPGTEYPVCLCPCQGRLRMLQGHCVQPRERSPAGGTGESLPPAATGCL